MKLGKLEIKKEYSKLLKGFDKAKASYKEAKENEADVKQALKEDAKNLSKVEVKALILLIEQAKHVSKAEKINVKIAKLLIKQWTKASSEAVAAELKQRGTKAKTKAEPVEAAEAPASKKQKRQSKAEAETAVEAAEAPAPKKRGRQPKPKVEVEVAEVAEAAASKKTRQRKEKVEAIVDTAAETVAEPAAEPAAETVVDTAPKRRGRQAKAAVEAEVEEGVAGVSARAMEVADEAAPQSREKRPRRSREEIAEEKTAQAEAAKAALKGDDFKVIEGVGPKVTAILHDSGIFSYQDLAEKSYDELKALMMANRQYLVKPHNWAKQAQLAADGKMEELEALKAALKAGV